MRGLVVFLRWISPFLLAILVMAALLHGCRAVAHAAPVDVPSTIAPETYNFKLWPGQRPPAGAVRLFGDVYSIRTSSAMEAEAALAGQVEWWEPNGIASIPAPVAEDYDGGLAALATVNDPLVGQQWGLARMGAPAAWDTTRGAGVVIAVLDTGADFTHPDLQGRFVSHGKDFVNRDDDATDDHGHGTHVSGIAAAVGNNGLGMAGVAYEAKILPVKVLAASGSGDHATIASGIAWAADQGAKVINLSLGGSYGSNTLEAAVDYAWGKGAVLTCAAGNDGRSNPGYPAAYTNCLAVAATDSQDRLGSFSNFGSWVDVAAPGVQVLGTVRGGRYESWNGTSMAAPNAAGVAALVWAAHPSWSNAQVRSAMEAGAEALAGNPVRWGRLNAARAVGGNPSPQPSPTGGRGGSPTATPLPRPQPTPAPMPTPTGIPTPPPFLARGYWMTLTVPAYAPTLALWRTRSNLCQPYQGRGVVCQDFIGRPLVAVIDYDVASPLAPHYAWWWVYEPYKAYGVTVTVRRK